MRFFKENVLYIAWFQALIATTGSLFFSEVLKFPPCVLCWYQRIFMYPLVVLIAVGILRKDKAIYHYILPLAGIGWAIAFFHFLLYKGVIPESEAPCQLGISCTTKFIEWFGFVDIPFLSLCSFTVIIVCMLIYKKQTQKTK